MSSSFLETLRVSFPILLVADRLLSPWKIALPLIWIVLPSPNEIAACKTFSYVEME
jgi:hypothetical protein